MTQKEINKFLANTKVYVAGKSKEIQEKLFSFGFSWLVNVRVSHTEEPFLYLDGDKKITWGNDMQRFTTNEYREITAEQILSLELTEPAYRQFKNQEECLNEMLKHNPFGWLYDHYSGDYVNVSSIQDAAIELMPHVNEEVAKDRILYKEAFKRFDFLDGFTFGIEQ